MIKTVFSVDLPIDETLYIKKMRIEPEVATEGKEKRISIVTGTHGDELEGQYVCYELQRRIMESICSLKGIVDIYPALNPLGIDCINRGFPAFDLDMNRVFPGSRNNAMPEYVARGIMDDLEGSDVCIDIHASNIFLKELPQARINANMKDRLVPLAVQLNLDFIWVHPAATVLEATLAHSLNSIVTNTIVVEMGVGMRITKEYTNQLVDGIFNLMIHMGIWDGENTEVRRPMISENPEDVYYINAAKAGLFVPVVGHCTELKRGDYIGDVLNPLTGEAEETILSPSDGILFTLREYPIVDEGSLIARIYDHKRSGFEL